MSPVTANVLFTLSHVKLPFSVIDDVPFPSNKQPDVKLLAPVSPRETTSVPTVTLLTFKFVKRDPLPDIFEAFNILSE